MNFGEFRFWGILLSGLALITVARLLASALRKGSLVVFDKLCLAALGFYMLGVVSRETLVIYSAVMLLTYFGLGWITRAGSGGVRWLWLLVPLQVAPLIYYKYSRFLLHDLLGVEWSSLKDLVIPVGISFYTFQKVAFAVDTLVAKKPIPSFLDYLNFAGFFPQLVAGPIERREKLLPQIEAFRFKWSPEAINKGVSWIVLGLFFKCCLADNLAVFFSPAVVGGPLTIWKQNLLFGLRIYYDFAGYSLTALGIAACLGVDLTLNFASPYCAATPTDFWRRWHITLSQWFRDYIYLPLGGGRVAWWWANVLLVFLLSGVWHGAGWNFLAWGALHAVFLIADRMFSKRRLPGLLNRAITLVLVLFSWMAFYETRPAVLLAKINLLINPLNYSLAEVREAVAGIKDPNSFVCLSFILVALLALGMEAASLKRGEAYSLLRKPWVQVVLIILTVWLAPGKTNDFIYFAF